jgi:ABC-2 type transport system permease protein
LASPSVEVAQSAGLLWLFPVSFISPAFVSAQNLPEPLRVFAEWNPFSAVIIATRDLFDNVTPAMLPQPNGWPAQNALLYAVLCSVAILAIFMPLAVAKYRRVASK